MFQSKAFGFTTKGLLTIKKKRERERERVRARKISSFGPAGRIKSMQLL